MLLNHSVPSGTLLRVFVPVFAGEPSKVAPVLDVKVAVLDDDEIHVLDDTDGQEGEGVAEELACYYTRFGGSNERAKYTVSVHHGEERVGGVAEVVEVLCQSPEGCHSKQAEANKDWCYSKHDLAIHRDGDSESSCDDTVLVGVGEVSGDADPVK